MCPFFTDLTCHLFSTPDPPVHMHRSVSGLYIPVWGPCCLNNYGFEAFLFSNLIISKDVEGHICDWLPASSLATDPNPLSPHLPISSSHGSSSVPCLLKWPCLLQVPLSACPLLLMHPVSVPFLWSRPRFPRGCKKPSPLCFHGALCITSL